MSQSLDHMLSQPHAVNVAHAVECCRVLGPGKRFIVWTQGCPLCCPGCHNPQFQPFKNRLWLTVDKLAAAILATKGIEGVTYVGGEPFAQARALAKLSRKLHTAGLTVMVYSGFTLEQLQSGEIPYAKLLLSETDLLLDGPYQRQLPTNRPWRGSDNQRLILLSDRYYPEQIELWNKSTGRQFEVHFNADGTLEVLGIPPADLAYQKSQ